jgi:prepilin-type N-terminal cleavage/methylation domain-containing protein
MKRKPGLSAVGGFSLVEFIVAIAVVGIAVVPLISAYYYSWKASMEADNQSEALMVARWKIGRLRSTESYNTISDVNRGNCLTGLSNRLQTKFDCRLRVEQKDDPPRDLVKLWIFYESFFGGERTIDCPNGLGNNGCNNPDFVTTFTKKHPP